MCQELNAIKANQTATANTSQMDTSSNMDSEVELNCIKEKAESDRKASEQRLAQTRVDYEKALDEKKEETAMVVWQIKDQMEQQLHRKQEALSKANKQNLQAIMAELHNLKEKQECDAKEHKSGKKALLDNIMASTDPIITAEILSSQIGEGAKVKRLQEEINNYCPPTITIK